MVTYEVPDDALLIGIQQAVFVASKATKVASISAVDLHQLLKEVSTGG